MDPKNPVRPHVLIIGAGITGLLVAHGLQKAGLKYTIFDAEAETDGAVRPREWTMGVHWGLPLMEDLLPAHLVARLVAEASVDPTLDYGTPPCNGSVIYDGVSGEVLKELRAEGRLLRISRRKTRELLKEGIPVQFGHKFEEIFFSDPNNLVAVRFSNGRFCSGTLLVGCDGPRSEVRTQLFRSRPQDGHLQPLAGTVHLSTTFCYGDAARARFVRKAHPVGSMMIHPDLFTYLCIQDVPDPDRPESWVFFVFVSWFGAREARANRPAERVRVVKEKAARIQEPFRSAILWIPDEVTLPYVDIGSWVATLWDTQRGRITLAGDAAHPMPPYRGQGLNHAILDASHLVKLVRGLKNDGDRHPIWAVDEYSKEVARRGADETALSRNNAYMLLAYHGFKDSPYMKHGLSKQ